MKGGERLTYEYGMVTMRQIIGSRMIIKRGSYPPERIVPGNLYVEEMEKRGIVIEEKVHRSALKN